MGGCVYKPVIEKPDEAGFMPAELEGGYPVFSISWNDMMKELEELGLEAMEEPEDKPDRNFYFTDEATWRLIIPNISYPGEYFPEKERKDCDDYAKKASADSSFYYGLGCLRCLGHIPGYHAFNLVKIEGVGWRIFEPNLGIAPVEGMFEIGEHGYKVEKWKS